MAKNSPFKRADVALIKGARAAYEGIEYKGELVADPITEATDKILEDYEKKQLKQQIDQERLAGAIHKNKQATKLTGGWNYGNGQKVFARQMNEWSDEFAGLEKRKIALRDAGIAGGEEWMGILDQQADITEYAGEIKAQLDALETKRQTYFDANDSEKGGNLSSASGGKSLQNGIYLKDYSIEIKKDANGRPIVGFRVDGKFVSHEDVDKNNVGLIDGLGDSILQFGENSYTSGKKEGSDWKRDGETMARQYVNETFRTDNDIISGFYDSYSGDSPYKRYMKTYNQLTPEQRIKQGFTIEPLSPESFGEVGSDLTPEERAAQLNFMKERISDTYVAKFKDQFDRGVTSREKAERLAEETRRRNRPGSTFDKPEIYGAYRSKKDIDDMNEAIKNKQSFVIGFDNKKYIYNSATDKYEFGKEVYSADDLRILQKIHGYKTGDDPELNVPVFKSPLTKPPTKEERVDLQNKISSLDNVTEEKVGKITKSFNYTGDDYTAAELALLTAKDAGVEDSSILFFENNKEISRKEYLKLEDKSKVTFKVQVGIQKK